MPSPRSPRCSPLTSWRVTPRQADLVDHPFNSSEKRLARTLLLLANFGKEGKPEPMDHKNQPGDACRDGWDDPAAG